MLNRFSNWLKVEVSGWRLIRLLGVILLVDMMWMLCALSALYFLGYTPPKHEPVGIHMDFSISFFSLIVAMAALEEVIFRAPLLIAVLLENLTKVIPVVMLSALTLSLVFGYAHGSAVNIVTQGVGGLLYSIVFLKCGGYKERFLKPLTASTAAHALWNSLLFSILISAGFTEF